MTKKARAHVVFHGRVQGVCFRAYTQAGADREGVVGWVRNLLDGTVEAVFEGERDRIEDVIEYCSNRQPHARVTRADVIWEDYVGEFKGFGVRH